MVRWNENITFCWRAGPMKAYKLLLDAKKRKVVISPTTKLIQRQTLLWCFLIWPKLKLYDIIQAPPLRTASVKFCSLYLINAQIVCSDGGGLWKRVQRGEVLPSRRGHMLGSNFPQNFLICPKFNMMDANPAQNRYLVVVAWFLHSAP